MSWLATISAAALPESDSYLVNLLLTVAGIVTGAMATAIVVLYRDKRKDRVEADERRDLEIAQRESMHAKTLEVVEGVKDVMSDFKVTLAKMPGDVTKAIVDAMNK